MTTPEDTTLSEKIRLNYIARKLEELSSPREITIASIRYQEQLEEALAREKHLKALLDNATNERNEAQQDANAAYKCLFASSESNKDNRRRIRELHREIERLSAR